MASKQEPLVLAIGAAGRIGTVLGAHLAQAHKVVGFDLEMPAGPFTGIACDLGSDAGTRQALAEFKKRFGTAIAAGVHLAAYFDFTGEDNKKYRTVNVEGTARLMDNLQAFDVERLIFVGSILVHRRGAPGDSIHTGGHHAADACESGRWRADRGPEPSAR